MSKLFKTTFLALLVILLASGSMFAQGAGFGSITGVVSDSTGAVVPDAKVVIDNPSKGIHRELTTTSAGTFAAPALVPADGYKVVVSKSGFANYEVKEITVTVGQAVTLSPSLQVSGSASTVEVTAAAPVIDATKTSTSTVVDSDQILELPINGRRVDTFVMLSPGVSNDGVFGLLSFRGNPGGNTFLTDGADTTNSYYGENAGRTRTYNISQDAVQEFQVVSSNYAAEYGKASGGVVNTVTRSGSNSFHGSAYEFFRNRTLNAVDKTTVTKVGGVPGGLYPKGINPPEWRHQAGLSIGGPIMKDKLFFFFNGELFRRNAPAVSSNLNGGAGNNLFNGDGTFKAKVGNSQNGFCDTTVATAAQCKSAMDFVSSRALPQLIDRTMNNNLAFGKIDWRPTSTDSISISSNYVDFRSPNGIQTQLSLTNGSAIGNNADTNVFDRTGRLSWTRVLGNNKLNEFRFGLFKDRQVDPASAQLLPTFGAVKAPVAISVNSVSNLGYAQNYPRVNPSELRLEFADNFSINVGKHNYKFGGTVAHLEDYVESMPSQFPFYSYDNLTQFALDFDGTTPAGSQHYSTFSQTVGTRAVDLKLYEISAYAQDEWHVTPKFVLTPGVRMEFSTVPQPTICNPRFQQTCKIPNRTADFSPRLGLAYSIDNKTAIHAGFGVFNNRYTTSTIENLMVTNGVYQKGYSYSTSNGLLNANTKPCLPTFPQVPAFNWTPTGNCATAADPSIIFADPKFRSPYSEQANLAVEREIVKNTSLSVSYVWSRTLHIAVTKDTNVLNPVSGGPVAKYQVYDAAGNATDVTFTTPLYTSYNPVYANGTCTTAVTTGCYKGRVSMLQSAGNSYYNALLVTLNRRQGKWFQGSVSYTYGHTIGYGADFAQTFGSTTPSSFINGDYKSEKGSSQLDRRHNLVVNAVFQPKFMNSDGMFAKYVVNGWQLALVNVAASSQPTAPTVNMSSSFKATGALLGGLNGLNAGSRVPFESLSAVNIGPLNRLDARLSKNFPVTERVNVALGFEVFNVFNHLIVSGRDSQEYTLDTTKNAQGYYPLRPRTTTFGAVNATQVTPDGTTYRRAQAVARITF